MDLSSYIQWSSLALLILVIGSALLDVRTRP